MSMVLLERPKPGLALMRMNRPEVRNALNLELRRQMTELLATLVADQEVRCILVAGNEKVFAAGADIAEMAEADPVTVMRRAPHGLWNALAQCPKPIVAAVNGFALGAGCELALHADVIVAGEGARIGLPEVKLGILPGGGGTQRLIRAVGKYKALRMILTGEIVSAREADTMGMLSLVVPDAETEARAIEIAAQIAAMPPVAVELIKEVTLAGADGALDEGLRLERKALHVLFSTQDQKEGMRAFLEKRPPNYTGR